MSNAADVKIVIAGKEYELDFEKLTMGDRRDIKRLSEGSFGSPEEWIDGLMQNDVDAIASLAYVCKKRAGETVSVETFWPLFERVSGTDGVQIIMPEEDEDNPPADAPGGADGATETTPEPSGENTTDESST